MKNLPNNPFQQWTRRLLQQRAERGLPITVRFLDEIWESLLGEELAANTRPLSLQEGHLKVAVASTMWLHELARHRRELLRRLNHVLPEQLKELELVPDPRGQPAPPQKEPTRRAPRLGRMPPEEERLLHEVEDEELRTILTRIRRMELGRKD